MKRNVIILCLMTMLALPHTVEALNAQTLFKPTPTPSPTWVETATPTTPTPTITPKETAPGTPPPPEQTPTVTAVLPTATPTVTPTVVIQDAYEPDSVAFPAPYIGKQMRSFNPEGDVDYVNYLLKAGMLTWIETEILGGSADTFLKVYRDNGDGRLTDDELLGFDDDSGPGLGSQVGLQVEADTLVVIVIENRSVAYSPDTAYLVQVISQAEATPTPTPRQTEVPPATWTPLPTYTPYPTVVSLPTSPPPPPRAMAANPQPTPTPQTNAIRIHIFLDMDGDGLLDPGEGAHHVLVTLTSLDGSWTASDYTSNGSLVIPCPIGSDGLIVSVPYLHQSEQVELNDNATSTETAQVDFVLTPPVYPVQLP